MRFLIVIVAQILLLCSIEVLSDETSTQPSLETLQKMPIKQLKAMLSSKGMDCVGCTEKAEYVSKAFESLSMPLVEDNATKSSSEEAKGEDSSSTADKPEEKGKVDKIKKEELDDMI
eukprot:gene31384-40773_t